MEKKLISLFLLLLNVPALSFGANIFTDGFETGNLSKTENSVSWGDTNYDSQDHVGVSSVRARTGTYSLRFLYSGGGGTDDAWAEQRMDYPSQTELYIQYYLYIPSNYDHRSTSDGQGTNNKFIAIYRNPYITPGFQINLSTEPSGDGDSVADIRFYENGVEQFGVYGGSECFTSANYGKWNRIDIHVKAPTNSTSDDGVVEMSVDGVESVSSTTLNSYGGSGENYFDQLYLMGWSNSGYDDDTIFYLDDIIMSTTPIAAPTATAGTIINATYR